ncbi:MAG TPA: glutamine--fructose-6-phosphate transaminase (isomerizing) [Gammaproteobacteria bacterium]|nr:glutamine--fructose-6-phosphate transaminase (isomerizing) [Gammaproteobacteria bacterium]
MCGIVGAVADREVTPILIEGLKRLEYRGYDSAGVAVQDSSGEFKRCRAVGKVARLEEALLADSIRGYQGIAHTRWATHGGVTESNAHPHVSGTDVCLVHNGIIENYQALRTELTELGFEFSSDTDTEVIAHLIASYLQQSQSLLDAVRNTIKRLTGAYALAVMSPAHPDRIVAARLGCPLVVGKGIGENYLASDVLALRAVTDRFIFLEEGDVVEIQRDNISVWNVEAETVVRADVKVEFERDDWSKGNYRHFMQKEIFEQPRVIKDTLEGRISANAVMAQALGHNSEEVLNKVKAVTIVACGTSFYAASVARYWFESVAKLPCSVEIASEFRYRDSTVLPDSLFVTLSQSGETADTLAALRVAKKLGYRATLTICNVATSSMVRESDIALLINAGSEIGVASTKAFTAQLTDLLWLTALLARNLSDSSDSEVFIVESLRKLPAAIERMLDLDGPIQKLALNFIEKDHALFLGRGPMYPIALEGALKLKEISYIHAEGYAAGELKHGPLALVDEDMPVVAVAPNDELIEKLQSNLQEVSARGGKLFIFASEKVAMPSDSEAQVISLPDVDPLIAPIAYVVPLQLLAYHVAVLKGTDVDQPRNLAKSVTVE